MKRFIASVFAVAALVTPAYAATMASWGYESSTISGTGTDYGSLVADTGVFAGTSISSGHHASSSTFSSPTGNGSTKSFSSNTWAIGDYYQFVTSTTGYSGVVVDWDQTSSNTGPGQVNIQYSTNGTTFTTFGGLLTILANATPNTPWSSGSYNPAYHFSIDLSSVSALDNQANIYIRITDASTLSANGGTVASGGTSRIDNMAITAAPEPASLALLALGGLFFRRR